MFQHDGFQKQTVRRYSKRRWKINRRQTPGPNLTNCTLNIQAWYGREKVSVSGDLKSDNKHSKQRGSWKLCIVNCSVLLGTFDTTEVAEQVYDTNVIEFRDVKVKTNFLNLIGEMNRTPSQVSIVDQSSIVVAVVAIQPLPPPLPPPHSMTQQY
ncbi:Ethylene-responsive transcription factor 11 [Capsicum baccatum]|uniref:Ethylene-responsive transcription factor 11 n=1 Tax=Capsicum baccatum TaxID=33114 RepID=A0A2G2VB78_CAPBA|nr:Ethylene-responsive transcription factor 11 [Capsicum baccatum]